MSKPELIWNVILSQKGVARKPSSYFIDWETASDAWWDETARAGQNPLAKPQIYRGILCQTAEPRDAYIVYQKMKKISVLRLTVFVAALAGLSSTCKAQNPLGSLRGTVTDTSGGRVASATVSTKNPETALVRQRQSDVRGEFLVEDLPAGSYEGR
jgi:hypothetical protein